MNNNELKNKTPVDRLRVLLVPDSIYWVIGTIAKQIAFNNPWIEATICSSPIMSRLLDLDPSIVERIDLVHFIDEAKSRTLLPKLMDKVPCVTTIHHVLDWQSISHNQNGDAVMVVSREWKEDLIERGIEPDRLVWVSNGVDTFVFSPPPPGERARSRRRLKIAPDSFAIGFFSKITSNTQDRKGTDVLIRGLVKMARHLSNVVAVIVGPGWEKMTKDLQERGVKCCWLPFIMDHDDVAKVYQALDVYWITSRIEGGPVTLLEAMSSEVCCVTTPVGMAKEVIRDGVNGFIVPINDVNALVARTVELARDADMQRNMARAGRDTIMNGYQWEQTTGKVSTLYKVAQHHFQQRTSRVPKMSYRLSYDSKGSGNAGTIPLNAVDVRLRRWVRMEENLYWIRGVADNREAAMKLCIRALRENPLSMEPWTQLLMTSLQASPSLYQIMRKAWQPIKRLRSSQLM